MSHKREVLTAKGGFFTQTYREDGLLGCLKKVVTGVKMNAPLLLLRRRTNKSVGAYFDLITEDGRMFYGDSFHFGFFHSGAKTLAEGLDAHTDIVTEMARIGKNGKILDIGCGICAPAIRIVGKLDCSIIGVNISKEQVRHGKELVQTKGLSDRIKVLEGNALNLDFADNSFDSILCIEVAGDICVKEEQKYRLVSEMRRVLKPGGYIGFSDLVFTGSPSSEEEKSMRTILYHEGKELVTDWPTIFKNGGFTIEKMVDMIQESMDTWKHSISVYEQKSEEVKERYGKLIAESSLKHLRRIPLIIQKYGSFPVMSLRKI